MILDLYLDDPCGTGLIFCYEGGGGGGGGGGTRQQQTKPNPQPTNYNTFANCVKDVANNNSAAKAFHLDKSRVGNILLGSTTSAVIELGQDLSKLQAAASGRDAVGITVGYAAPSLAKSVIDSTTTVTSRVVVVRVVTAATSEGSVQAVSVATAKVAAQSLGGRLAGKALGLFGLATLGYDLFVATPVAVGACYESRGGF